MKRSKSFIRGLIAGLTSLDLPGFFRDWRSGLQGYFAGLGRGGYRPPPIIISGNQFTQNENSAFSLTLLATQPSIFFIVGGADASSFLITGGTTLNLGPKDYDVPVDVGTNNTWEVQVIAVSQTTGKSSAPQTITVSIADLNDTPPVITSPNAGTVAEGVAFSMALTANKIVTWAITGGADMALFSITGGNTLNLPAQDFESPADQGPNNNYVVEVTATDGTGQQSAILINVTVTDVPETVFFLDPGVVAPGTGAAATAIDNTNYGLPLDSGYNERPFAAWVNGMHDKATGIFYFALDARKVPTIRDYLLGRTDGIKQIEFFTQGGTPLVVNSRSTHPVTGTPDVFVGQGRTADFASSGRIEIRARVIPWSGKPFICQGIPDITTKAAGVEYYGTDTGSANDARYILARWRAQMWGLTVNIDKTGSALPKLVLYKAPETGGGGSDANNGLSSGAPLATWDGVLTKAVNALGSDLGGLEVRLTAGLNHEWGLNDQVRPRYECATQWFRVTRDPAVPRSSVLISSAKTFNPRVKKFWLDDVKTSVPIGVSTMILSGSNYVGAETLENAAIDVRYSNHDHDGGAGVDANGQPTGPNPIQGVNFGAQHKEFFNCNYTRIKSSVFNWCTANVNVTLTKVGTYDDLLNSCKAVFDFYANDMAATAAHMDGMQAVYGLDGSMVVRVKFGPIFTGQGVFADSGSWYMNSYFVEPDFTNAANGNNLWQPGIAGRNVGIWNPKMAGSTPTVLNWIDGRSASGVKETLFAYGSGVIFDKTQGHNLGLWESQNCTGWAQLQPGVVQLAGQDDFPSKRKLTSRFDAALGSKIAEVLDVRDPETLLAMNRDVAGVLNVGSVPSVARMTPHAVGVYDWYGMPDVPGSATLHRRRPTYVASAIAGGAAARYNGLNTLGADGQPNGQALFGLTVLDNQARYQPFATCGSKQCEVWFSGSFQDAAPNTTAKFMFEMGLGNSVTGTGWLGLFYDRTGGRTRIMARMGTGKVTASNNAGNVGTGNAAITANPGMVAGAQPGNYTATVTKSGPAGTLDLVGPVTGSAVSLGTITAGVQTTLDGLGPFTISGSPGAKASGSTPPAGSGANKGTGTISISGSGTSDNAVTGRYTITATSTGAAAGLSVTNPAGTVIATGNAGTPMTFANVGPITINGAPTSGDVFWIDVVGDKFTFAVATTGTPVYADLGSGFGDFAIGPFVARIEAKLSSITLTIWNAGHPSGVSVTTNVAAGFAKSVGYGRSFIGTQATSASGSATAHAQMDWVSLVTTNALLSNGERDAVLAIMKTDLGLP